MSTSKRQQIDADYYGYAADDITAAYHNGLDFSMEAPVGDLFDDDTYWLTGDEIELTDDEGEEII